MFKKYNPRFVRAYTSYSIAGLCRLYREHKLHPQTIRAWIKSGDLEAIPDGNKIIIYGAVFKQFLVNRNQGRKRTLQGTEFLCRKCKAINIPLENTIISVVEQQNGCFNAIGMCPNCAFMMKRIYKRSAALEIMDLFKVEPEALIILSDISCSLSKTHIQEVQKLVKAESQTAVLSNQTNKFQDTTQCPIQSKQENYHD